MMPRVAFGMTLYNNARHLPEALDSLLSQTDANFGIYMLDDASSDGTEEIARAYAARDCRLRYERRPVREAMVATWRDVFHRARQAFPSARYFAWASDHDRWLPEWLVRVRAELEAHDEAVLAYTRSLRMDDAGNVLSKQPKTFDTAGLVTPAARWKRFCGEAAGAGDLVYGLMRIEAVERGGVFRRVLLPDRLLMLEMTLLGEFRQVPDALWIRRQSGPSSVARQRVSLFTPANAPRAVWLAPWLQHAGSLWRTHVRRGHSGIPAATMARLILQYEGLYLLRQYSKSTAFLHTLAQSGESVQQVVKEVKSRSRWAIDDMKVAWARSYGQNKRRWRRLVYDVAVTRRRARAAAYEAIVSLPTRYRRTRRRLKRAMHEALVRSHLWRAQIRRAAKRGLHRTLLLTHRLGLRDRS